MMGIPFTVHPSHVSEHLETPLPPSEHVVEISNRKASAVAPSYKNELVLGADTIVVLGNDILEKPADTDEAVHMLTQLAGNTHKVLTGVTLINTATGKSASDVAVTGVTFRPLSNIEIHQYVSTGDSLDKAGAYAAQGQAAVFIESISGCFYNVVGLPLTCFWNLICSLTGESPWDLVTEESIHG